MRKNILAALCSCVLIIAHSQETTPAMFTSIPENLKKDADAVYRLDEGILDILSPSEYTLKVHQVITILNAEGVAHLHHRMAVNKFYKVEDVEIKMFDVLGLLVKKYGKKDFETEAAYDGVTLMTDDKVMRLYTPAASYPCTVDVQYKVHATGYVELPNWHINYHKAATEVFRYEVNVPAAMDIRQRTLNMNATPQINVAGNTKHYTWEVKNVAAKKLESEGFETARYLPQVEVEPNEFSYDGYKGEFHTWADFGLWNYKLYEEKAPFTEERIAEIKSLVRNAKSREEKISTLYQYLQQNMRYVSIQLGIGGFKPFAVKFVDEKKYGDCKALTNYMRYLLRVVDINAYPALINAGNDKVPADPQFPSDPFNHVILCIPTEKDTSWLECTSQYSKAGELGTFTENKRALLLTEKGGVLVNTPRSAYKSNTVATKNDVTIKAEGGATVQNKIWSSGEEASFYKYVLQLKDDEQKEMLMKSLRYKNPDEMSISLPGNKTEAGVDMIRTYEKFYDFKAGNKYFFPLCVNHLAMEGLKMAIRETDFLSAYPYEKSDTTVFRFPAGFALEATPADKELQTAYGYYKRSCRYDAASNQLTTISSFALTQHVIPAAAYVKHAQFFNAVVALEEEIMVLTKQ
jgi:hypothetical protein